MQRLEAKLRRFYENIFQRSRIERDFDEELRSHLDELIERMVEAGTAPEIARREALAEIGTIEAVKESVRAERVGFHLEALLRDAAYALRKLRREPGFSLLAVLTLALGIGANIAIFSMLQGVLLKPLPYREPDRLVALALYNRTLRYPTYASYPDFIDWQHSSRCFEQIAAAEAKSFDLTNPGPPQHIAGEEVSSNFFSTLGITLAIGRGISAAEDGTEGAPAVVISDRLWRERFAGSSEALGKIVTLDGVDYPIVGVLHRGFRFDKQEADAYTSIARDNALNRTDRTVHNILGIARLLPNVTIEQALAEMDAVQAHIAELHPDTERGQGAWVEGLKHYLVGDIGRTLFLLLGAVGLLLLIACANVTNLLLARSAARTREFAIRLALGAGRSRIVRQTMVETTLLFLAGGLVGLAFASWTLPAILAAVPGSIPRAENVGINGPVLAFAIAVSLVAGIVFGVLPSRQSSKADVHTGLSGGRYSTVPQTPQRLLAIGQIALTLVLLTGGSLLVRTLLKLGAVNPGFEIQHLITFQVGLSRSVTETASGTRNAYRQLIGRLRAIPGVEAADMTANVPLSQGRNEGPFWLGSDPPASMAEIPRAIYYPVGTEYFSTLKIPLVGGRSFSDEDTADSEFVVVIDSLLARSYFPNSDPVDQYITIPHWGAKRDVAARIVGVVGHVEQYGLNSPLAQKPEIYYSFYQLPDDAVPVFRGTLRLAVRTLVDNAAMIPVIQKAVYVSGGDQPVYNVETMQEFVAGSLARHRFSAFLILAFAGLALVLAFIGTYAVISYSTMQRMQEIGIRIALGAGSRDVVRLVIKQGIWLAAIGITLGSSGALILIRIMPGFSQLLYGISTMDPITFASTALILLLAALLACYIPARRAARLDPVIALRIQ